MSDRLTTIGVFYDGNYFLHVSNFYNYDHPRRARLSIDGLHRFIEARVGEELGKPGSARIVESHYFRGRLSAQEAQNRGSVLYYDRVFDDILMSSGVTTHYSPLRNSQNGRRTEKGIDVWLALEAFEQAMLRKLDVVVLIASDSDYVPLVRKIQSLGCRVMVLGWDFEFTTDNGSRMITRTSQDLLQEASNPQLMTAQIDNPRSKEDEELINGLFVAGSADKKRRVEEVEAPKEPKAKTKEVTLEEPTEGKPGDRMESEVFSLKNGYGFIKYPPNNLFFHHTTVENVDFSELYVNDHVGFTLTHNDKGQLVATEVELLEDFEQE